MNTLETIFRVAGFTVLLAAALQAAVWLVSSLRRTAGEREQRRLSAQLLEERLSAVRAQRTAEGRHAELVWDGLRKFEIQRKVQEGGGICSIYLVPHDGKRLAPFKPGQYLTFQLKIPDQPKPVIRCYSLSDGFSEQCYRVSIKKLPPPPKQKEAPPGLVSTFFHDVLQEGDIVDVRTPGGHFFLDMTRDTPVVLIGGGVGITPVLSMLNSIVQAGSTRETWFFYGVRHGGEHIFKEHLQNLAREHENVRLHVCYSDPGKDDMAGRDFEHAERVSVELFKRLLPGNNYDYYICGPPPMMDSLTRGLAEWGVPETNVHFEAFGPASVKKPAAKPATTDVAADSNGEVKFSRSGKAIRWDPSVGSLLDFAEQHGIALDSGCRAGNCGTCVVAVKSGDVEYVNEPGVPPEPGTCLTCISIPKGDLTLDA